MAHSLPKDKQLRGVFDIEEDGYGGFTMDSVFYRADENDKWVTSIFKKIDPKTSAESENWNPSGFNFKAAVDGSPPRRKTEVKGERIKEIHQSKKGNSGKRRETKDSMVKRHLEGAFGDSNSDILSDVTNEFNEENTSAGKKKQEEKGQKAEEQGIKDWMKSMKEEHGIECIYGEHIKGKTGDFESLQVFPVVPSKEEDQKFGDQRIRDLKKNHGENCDCEEYVKNVVAHYESLGSGPLDVSKILDLMEEEEGEEKPGDHF